MGSKGNQATFISQTVAGAKANNIGLVIYYNADVYTTAASTLAGL